MKLGVAKLHPPPSIPPLKGGRHTNTYPLQEPPKSPMGGLKILFKCFIAGIIVLFIKKSQYDIKFAGELIGNLTLTVQLFCRGFLNKNDD